MRILLLISVRTTPRRKTKRSMTIGVSIQASSISLRATQIPLVTRTLDWEVQTTSALIMLVMDKPLLRIPALDNVVPPPQMQRLPLHNQVLPTRRMLAPRQLTLRMPMPLRLRMPIPLRLPMFMSLETRS